MKMEDRYNIIYLYIYVISIGDKSLLIHSNKKTGKVTTPIYRKKKTGKEF